MAVGYDLGAYEDDEQSGQSPTPKTAAELALERKNDEARAAYRRSMGVPLGTERVNAAYRATGPEKKSQYTLNQEKKAADALVRNRAANEAFKATEAKAAQAASLKAYTKLGGTRGVYAKYLSGQIDQSSLMQSLGQEIGAIRAGAGLSEKDPAKESAETYRMVSEEIRKLNQTFERMAPDAFKQLGIQTAQSGPGGTGTYIPSYRPPTDYGGYSPAETFTPEEVRQYYPGFKTGMAMPDMSQKARKQITADREQQRILREQAQTVIPTAPPVPPVSARSSEVSQPYVPGRGGGGRNFIQQTPQPTAVPGLPTYDEEGNLVKMPDEISPEERARAMAQWQQQQRIAEEDYIPDPGLVPGTGMDVYQKAWQQQQQDEQRRQQAAQQRAQYDAAQEERAPGGSMGGGYGMTDLGDTSDPNQTDPRHYTWGGGITPTARAAPADTPPNQAARWNPFAPSTAYAQSTGGSTPGPKPSWLREMPDGSGMDDQGFIYKWDPELGGGQWRRADMMVGGSAQQPPVQQPPVQQPPVQQPPPVQGQPGGSYDPRTDLSRVWDDYLRWAQRGGMQQPSDFERYGFPTQGPGYNILDPSDPMYGVIPGTEGDAPGTKGIQPGEEGPLSTRGMLSASGEMGVETEGLGWNADSIRANINNLPPGDFRMDKLADLLQMYEKFESGVATASSAADAKLALETMKQEYETQETIAANTLLATQRDEDQEWQQELHRQKAFIDSQEAAFNEASRKAEITGLWDGTQTLSAMNLEAQNAAARTAAERATEREQWQRGETEAERKYQGERAKAQEALAGQAADRQEVLDKAALVRVESEKIRTQKSKDEFAMTTKMMMAEATGILDGNPTMAGETFAMTRAMQEAEITGKFRPYEMTADGPAAMEPWGTGQTTMAAKSLAFQQDLQMYKEDTTRQLSENTLKIAENANQTNILIESKKRAIEQGKLDEAIDARRGQQKIEQDKLGLETNRLKLETVMSMANPVTLMIFQRSGLMPVLERLLGVELGFPDFPQMLPEGETIPTQQYLTYGSPMDRRLMMTEASLRSGMSDADVQSVIHRQMPGGMGVAIGYRGEGR